MFSRKPKLSTRMLRSVLGVMAAGTLMGMGLAGYLWRCSKAAKHEKADEELAKDNMVNEGGHEGREST